MNTEAFFRKNKGFYAFLLKYIEGSNDSENEFQKIDELINEKNILEDKTQIFEVLKIVSRIWNNYHRTPDLFIKLDKILKRILQDKNCTISNNELFQIFKDNKLLLHHLFKNGFFQYDKILSNDILKNKELCTYLYPSIKPFLNEDRQKEIEEKISELKEDLESFEKKCHKGENDSLICILIQQDSIDEFITYVNRTNLSLSSTIDPTIFETNPFLYKKKKTSLIEYAAFYGSIQIIRYLQFNKVQLNRSLWLYAIHSKSPELIQFLEENHVVPFDQIEILKEAIICHHNNIADYIIDNMLQQNQNKNKLIEIVGSCIGDSKNYYFYPDDIQMFLCKDSFNVSGFIDSFEEFTISSSVTSIGESVFRDCSSLKKIEIPSSVTSIGNKAFYDCLSLEKITIPSSITSINNEVFCGCSSLKEIEIPSSVKSIGNNAFSDCLSLEKITIPSSVVSFGNNIFEGVTSLEIKGSIQSIPQHLFDLYSSIERIIFSSSVTSIDMKAFGNCISLEQVIIQSPLTSIEPYTFYECTSLENISIPSSVASIGRSAFSGCSSIESIEIPSSVTSIGSYAFYQCQSLKRISLPSSIISIEEQTFFGCSSLKEIIIPSSVIVIGNSAFYYCKCLKSVTIPDSVTTIYGSAFSHCKCLKKITIPASVTLIGDAVFMNCISMKQITILSSNLSIGNNIFNGCSKLKQISLPSSIDINLLQVTPDAKITII